MNPIHVTSHAVSRYRERVERVSYDEAMSRLTSPAILAAAEFGAKYVRLATGARVVIEDGSVVTVLPPDHFKRQVARKGLGRYGRTNRWEIEE